MISKTDDCTDWVETRTLPPGSIRTVSVWPPNRPALNREVVAVVPVKAVPGLARRLVLPTDAYYLSDGDQVIVLGPTRVIPVETRTMSSIGYAPLDRYRLADVERWTTELRDAQLRADGVSPLDFRALAADVEVLKRRTFDE